MNCKPCGNRWKHWENGGMATIGKTERKGFESLIAHLLFPQKISRSDSSGIPTISRTRQQSHDFCQGFAKASVNAYRFNIDNFMETSSSTAFASKKGLESCDSKPLYERPTLAMHAARRAKRIRSAAFTECAQTDAVPVTTDGQRRGCIHAGSLRGGLHGA